MIDYLHGVELTPLRKLLFMGALAGGKEVEDTASGNPLTFITDLAKPLKSCLASWTPTQSGSGDPSPDNVRPITGMDAVNVWHTGVNIFDGEFESGKLDNSGADSPSTAYIRSKNYISVVPGEKYRIVYTPTEAGTSNMYLFYYDKNKTYVSKSWRNAVEITIPSGVYWMRFYMDTAYSAGTDRDIAFNYPSTDTDFVPYHGTTYAVEFPDSVGTVYGGTLDLSTGVLTAEWKAVDMGTLDYTLRSSYGEHIFSAPAPNKKFGNFNLLSSEYKVEDAAIGNLSNNCIRGYSSNENVWLRNDSYSTASDIKDGMTGVQLAYELATPQTYQLTPQQITALLGNNTLWSDANNLSVTYLKKG